MKNYFKEILENLATIIEVHFVFGDNAKNKYSNPVRIEIQS